MGAGAQKSGRAAALPTPLPPRSLWYYFATVLEHFLPWYHFTTVMEHFLPWYHFATVMEHFLHWYHFTTVMEPFLPWYHFTTVMEHFLPWYHFTTGRDVTFSTLQGFWYFARSRSREIKINPRNPSKFTKTRKIPRNLVKIVSNRCLYNIFETYFSYWGYLLAVNLQIHLETLSLKRANNAPKLPGAIMLRKTGH